MPAEIYLKHRTSGVVYGPNFGTATDPRTLVQVDDELRHHLGFYPDSTNWAGGWSQGVQYPVALNADPADWIDRILRTPKRFGEARSNGIKVMNYLIDHYDFGNNSGSTSRYTTGKKSQFIDLRPVLAMRIKEYASEFGEFTI